MSGAWLEKLVGADAFSTTTAQFTQPAIGGEFPLGIADTSWMSAGMGVFVAGGGYYTVVTVTSATNATLRNVGATDNAAPTTSVLGGARISPAGLPGVNGVNGTNGAGRSAVRAVQTGSLPAYTYDATAKTLTANANGVLASTIFDGLVPLVADTNHDVLIVLEGTKNGLYAKTRDGSVSTTWQFTRRTDLDASGDFTGGVQVDVIDGATNGNGYKGTRWYLATTGAIVLDTTSTVWLQAAPKGFLEVDLARDYGLPTNGTDIGPTLQRFFDDTKALGIKRAGKLPASTNMAWDTLVQMYSNCALLGCGIDASKCFTNLLLGGPALIVGDIKPPTIYGTLVDTVSGATPLTLYDDINDSNHLWFDLTQNALRFNYFQAVHGDPTGWPAFEMLMNVRVIALRTTVGTLAHVISCRGRRTAPEQLDVAFSVFLNWVGQLKVAMRLTDLTTGVYGAITPFATGTSVVTGDGTITPTDDRSILIYVEQGGTVGTPGIKLRYSTDGGLTKYPGADATDPAQVIDLGTATSLTISEPRFTAKFNFAAGTMVAGESISCTTSGVQTTYNLTGPVMSLATNYEIALQYDGSNIKLYVSPTGGARDTGPDSLGAQNVAAHGKLLQKPWENTHLGHAQNYTLDEGSSDGLPAKIIMGAIRFCDANLVTPPSTTRTTIPINIAGQRWAWQPTTAAQQLKQDGTVRWWYHYMVTGVGVGAIYPRRLVPIGAFNHDFEIRDFTIDRGVLSSSGRAGSHIVVMTANHASIGPLKMSGGDNGLRIAGPLFFTSMRDLQIFVNRKSLVIAGGEATMLGEWVIDGGEIMISMIQAGAFQTGTLFMNGEDNTRGYFYLDQAIDSSFTHVILDDENCTLSQVPREYIRAAIQSGHLSFGGSMGAGLTTLPITLTNSNPSGRLILDKPMVFRSAGPCVIRSLDSSGGIVEIGAGVDIGTQAICNVDGKVRLHKGTLPSAAMSAGNESIAVDDASSTMAAGITTGTATKTFTTSGVPVGTTRRILILPQGNSVVIANGGPSGGPPLATVAAGSILSCGIRKNLAGDAVIVP